MFRPALLMVMVMFAALCPAQQQGIARFEEVLDNGTIHVDQLLLQPSFRAGLLQNTHDVIWIAIDGAVLTFVPPDGPAWEMTFRPGDVRIFRSFQARQVQNRGANEARAVVVQLKSRGMLNLGCFCSSSVEKAVCGCGGAAPLPDLWAVVVGQVTLSEATFAPGEGYRHGTRRDDSLVIAISNATIQDGMDGDGALEMKPGDLKWLPAGRHQLRNVGDAPARLVTLEF